MKKLIVIISLLSTTLLSAQEIQLQASKLNQKLAVEHIDNINKHTLFVYGEWAIGESPTTYIQTFYEYKINHFSVHAEFRSVFTQKSKWSNTYICGLSLPTLGNDAGYINISPLYRYDNAHMWQATATYGYYYKMFSFDGYFDLYGDKRVFGFSENKIKIHLADCFLGVNIEYCLAPRYYHVIPYLMIGITLK